MTSTLDMTKAEELPQLTSGSERRKISRLLTGLTSFPIVVLSILLLRVLWSCREEIGDPDIWWHLLNGKFIWLNHRLPVADTYSFTVSGANWIDHEWLSELIYHLAYSLGNLQGVFVVFTAACGLLITLIYLANYRVSRDPLVSALLGGAGMLLAMVGFGPRPQAFGWLCFAVLYLLLWRFRAGRRTGEIWAIPVLFGLWINLHGSWAVGLVVFGIFLVSGALKRDVGRFIVEPYTAKEIRQLIGVGVLSLCALFVNPYGYKLVNYPLDMLLHQNLNTSNIEEWAPVPIAGLRGQLVFLVLVVVFLLAAGGRRRWRIEDVLLSGFVLYAGLSHLRFLIVTGIVLPPIASRYVGKWSSYQPGTERRIPNVCLLAGACIAMAWLFPSEKKLMGDVEKAYPAHGLQLAHLDPTGRIFNRYEWGGYMEWSHPELKVFIDSRTDIFEYRGVLQDYLNIEEMKNSLQLLEQYKIRYVLESPTAPLSYLLAHASGWRRIYRDSQAEVFESAQKPANREEVVSETRIR